MCGQQVGGRSVGDKKRGMVRLEGGCGVSGWGGQWVGEEVGGA